MGTDGKCLMLTDSLTHSHTPNLEMLSHLKRKIAKFQMPVPSSFGTFVNLNIHKSKSKELYFTFSHFWECMKKKYSSEITDNNLYSFLKVCVAQYSFYIDDTSTNFCR